MTSMRRATFLAASALLLLSGTAAAQPAEPAPEPSEPTEEGAEQVEEKLQVGIKVAPPFVLERASGRYEGISAELWTQIAAGMGLGEDDYEYVEVSLEELLEGLESGRLDVGVAALTVTPERENVFDFSHPFYTSGLGIAVVPEAGSGWVGALKGFFSLELLKGVGALAAVLLLAGFLVWLFERRRNPDEFAEGAAGGLGAAFWWSAVTMTTVGYGDKTPRTPGGRGVALVWMFASIIIISSFTGAIASALTVGQLKLPVDGPEDLPDVRVGTLAASTSEGYLGSREIEPAATWDSPRDALQALAAGEVDAVVYDAPILRYLAKKVYLGKVRVLSPTFQRQDYAFGLRDGSPLREAINRQLLERITSEWWRDLLTTHLGED